MPDKFFRATGKSLQEWLELVPHELSHAEMAKHAEELGASPWWAQSITVEIERSIGRRKLGESCGGEINASASKTIPGDWKTNFPKLVAFIEPKLPITESSISETEKWRYWRAKLDDDTKVTINVSDSNGKTKIGVQHEKLADHDARVAVKEGWKTILDHFAKTLL